MKRLVLSWAGISDIDFFSGSFISIWRLPSRRSCLQYMLNEVKIEDGTAYLPQVRLLIREYARRLNRDLSFQHLEEELKDVAAKYSAPYGELLVAVENGNVLGMVAYHRHSEIRCEMKRLYVVPQARGRHIGECLVAMILEHACRAGYKEMVLDTITPLKAAIRLYQKYGFEECAPYYENPMPDVIYMRKALSYPFTERKIF